MEKEVAALKEVNQALSEEKQEYETELHGESRSSESALHRFCNAP